MKKILVILAIIIVSVVAIVMVSMSRKSKLVSSTSILSEESKEFLGRWGSGRVTLDITNEKNGITAKIRGASSAFEYSKWEYICLYESETKRLACTGKRFDITIQEDGTEVIKKIYENGKAYFTIVDGKIIWDDITENAGRDMLFIK